MTESTKQTLKKLTRRNVSMSIIATGLICLIGFRVDAKTRIALGIFEDNSAMTPYVVVHDPSRLQEQMRDQVVMALKKTRRYLFERPRGKKAKYAISISIDGYSLRQNNSGMKSQTGIVKLGVRITDSTSGEMVDSFQVEGNGSAGEPSPGDTVAGAGFGTADWYQYDPLGQATRSAIDYFIVHLGSAVPDEHDVDETVQLNNGRTAGQ